MPLLWRSSRESRSERCKRAFLLAPICKVLLQAALAMKRLGPSTCLPLIVPAPADPAPCPVFAALSYL